MWILKPSSWQAGSGNVSDKFGSPISPAGTVASPWAPAAPRPCRRQQRWIRQCWSSGCCSTSPRYSWTQPLAQLWCPSAGGPLLTLCFCTQGSPSDRLLANISRFIEGLDARRNIKVCPWLGVSQGWELGGSRDVTVVSPQEVEQPKKD